jgi:hypothetical protein
LTDPEGNVFDIGVRHSPGRASGLTQRQGTP